MIRTAKNKRDISAFNEKYKDVSQNVLPDLQNLSIYKTHEDLMSMVLSIIIFYRQNTRSCNVSSSNKK